MGWRTSVGLWLMLAAVPAARGEFAVLPVASEGVRTIRFGAPPPLDVTLAPGPLNMITFGDPGGSAQQIADAALQFDLGGLAGYAIESAILRVRVHRALARGGPDVPVTLRVSGYAGNDALVQLADFAAPASLAAVAGPIPQAADPLDLALDIDVTAFLMAQAGRYPAFRLTTGGIQTVVLWGSAAADPARRPVLLVGYAIPEPGSAVLLGAGLMLLAVGVRRWAR